MTLTKDYWKTRLEEVESDLNRARAKSPISVQDCQALEAYVQWIRMKSAKYSEEKTTAAKVPEAAEKNFRNKSWY